MKSVYFRTIQRSYPNSIKVGIPKEIRKHLELNVGDILMFNCSDGKIEIKKVKT